LKAVRVLQMLCTSSHQLIFAYEFKTIFGFFVYYLVRYLGNSQSGV